MDYNNLNDLKGKKLQPLIQNVTVETFLKEKGVDAELHIINGSVEIAPNIGLADAIVDIVSTGGTLFKKIILKKKKFCLLLKQYLLCHLKSKLHKLSY